MPMIGVTGHTNLTQPTVELVRDALRDTLSAYAAGEVTGVSCLAEGADSIFAETVLELGGTLEAILPAADYRDRKVKPHHAPTFDALLRRAARVRTMPYETSNRDAYEAANETLLATCDRLVAIWDGASPADKGGTAAVVQQARARGIPTEVIWPDGAARTAG